MHIFAQDKIADIVAEHGAPILMLSKDIVRKQYRALQEALPNVDIYYAIKAQPNRTVLATLKELGSNFDVCTNLEVDLVKDLNIEPSRLMHTHPIKKVKDIEYAIEYGNKIFIYDTIEELEKFVPYKDKVELVLRLGFRSKDAVVDLSRKFGAPPENGLNLIEKAHAFGINVRGLSFHVGSQNLNPSMYIEAIKFCHTLFEASAKKGIKLDLLDIGGGFPVSYKEKVTDIKEFCIPINAVLNELFSQHRVICEPGRFIAGPTMQLVSSVMGKAMRNGLQWYYLDDGVYGCYSGRVFDHADYTFHLLGNHSTESFPSVVSGPTCDSFDIVYDNIQLPKLEIGALIVSTTMGAYSSATATDFNFFPRTKIITVD